MKRTHKVDALGQLNVAEPPFALNVPRVVHDEALAEYVAVTATLLLFLTVIVQPERVNTGLLNVPRAVFEMR